MSHSLPMWWRWWSIVEDAERKDYRNRMIRERGSGGLVLGKIDSARGKYERINLETFCKETWCCHRMAVSLGFCSFFSHLVLHPPTPMCAQSPFHPPLHTPTKSHTWTIGKHYAQPLVDWPTCFWAHVGCRAWMSWPLSAQGHANNYHRALFSSLFPNREPSLPTDEWKKQFQPCWKNKGLMANLISMRISQCTLYLFAHSRSSPFLAFFLPMLQAGGSDLSWSAQIKNKIINSKFQSTGPIYFLCNLPSEESFLKHA